MFETLFIMEEIARTSPNSSGHRQIGLPLTAGRFRVKVCTPPTKMFNCIAPIQRNTLPETNKLQLKMDGWKTTLLLGWPNFRGYVSSREGNHLPFFLKSWKFHGFFVRTQESACNGFLPDPTPTTPIPFPSEDPQTTNKQATKLENL